MTPISSLLGMSGPIPPFTASSGGGGGGGGSTTATFTWKYHMHGNTMGGLKVYWKTQQADDATAKSGGTLNELAFTADGSGVMGLSGQQQSDETSAWKSASADLSSYAGETGRLVFLYYKTVSGFRGDAAIDNMSLTINGSSTSLVEVGSSTSTLWWSTTYSAVGSYSSAANAVTDFENGMSLYQVIDRGAVYSFSSSGTWFKWDGYTSSGSTGPSGSDSGEHYIYVETSSNQGMQSGANRYCFLVTNNTYTLS